MFNERIYISKLLHNQFQPRVHEHVLIQLSKTLTTPSIEKKHTELCQFRPSANGLKF